MRWKLNMKSRLLGHFIEFGSGNLRRSARPVLALVVQLIFLASSPSIARAQTVWFSPHSGPAGARDYLDLFKENAPWRNASSHISVIGFAADFVTSTPERDLSEIFADLNRRNIKSMVQMFPLAGRPTPEAPACGLAVEGYGAPLGSLMVARKVKRLGGEISYFTMDEPLFFGHDFDRSEDPNQNRNPRRRGCRLPISEVAADAAARFKDVRSVFPTVKIGDVEPFMEFSENQWEAELSNWFDAFEGATGERLAFFRLDLRWIAPWQSRMPKLIALLKRKGIPLQVIYDGSSNAGSDAAWTSQAKQRFQQFEGTLGIKPDGAVLQSWAAYPSRALPESDPASMTGLVMQYVSWKHARQQDVTHLP